MRNDALSTHARDRGLLLRKAGLANSVMRTLTSLSISDELLDAGLARLGASVSAVSGEDDAHAAREAVVTSIA